MHGMSRYYEEIWINRMNSLKNALLLEKNEDKIEMYWTYTSILSDLHNVFENISNPSKRQAILRTMTLIVVRIVVLKSSERMQIREYHRVMRDVITPIPSCFRAGENLSTTRDIFIERYSRRHVSHDSNVISNLHTSHIDEECKDAEDLSFTFIQDFSQYNLEARAIRIQRCFRGYLSRMHIANEEKDVRRLIGMETFGCDSADPIKKKLIEFVGKLQNEQMNQENMYNNGIRYTKDELRKQEGLKIRQKIRDERIDWATDVIALTNKIPDIAEFYTRSQEGTRSRSEQILAAISEDVQQFQNVLLPNMLSPEVYSDAVLRQELVEELRISEDEVIQRNFERIRNMTTSSAMKKSKAGAESKLKGKSGKSKSKKAKVLPGDKIEELKDLKSHQMLKMLVEGDMVYAPKNNKLDGLISHHHDIDGISTSSFSGNLSEAKRLLTEYCILPNLSKEIKEMLEEDSMIRSILIHGGKGSGKLSAVRAIACEIGAMIIELNLNNINQSYINESDGITKLVHMIFSVAKDPSYQPVIVSITHCEEIFQPLKKSSSGTIFSQLQKDLLLYKNQEVTKDRILIIGCSSAPWKIDPKLLQWKGDSGKPEKQGFFERIIHLPMPGYLERGLMWNDFVISALKRHGFPPMTIQIDSNMLSRKSQGYSGGQILKSVHNILCSPHAIRNVAKYPPIEIEAAFISALEEDYEIECEKESFEKFNKFLASILNSNNSELPERKLKK